VSQAAPPVAYQITQPGLARLLLDRYLPRLHYFLTRIGTLSKPLEMGELNGYLRNLSADIENEIRHKTYIPLAGKEFQPAYQPSEFNEKAGDPFVKPIHQVIRQIIGLAQGGDAASAQIAAVNRQSRVVRNILKTLQRTPDPLVLLGDPGTGKTMTLQQTAKSLAETESKRAFPTITLYVRLGEFHVEEGEVTPEHVLDYVKRVTPEKIKPYVDALDRAGDRLVIIFDGMDEMSRERYNEHTEALSRFAGARRDVTKTLFSCRITDFSPKFLHQRLALLPFNRAQIAEYLRKYIRSFPIMIDREPWSLKRLAKRLAQGGLPMEANNPFVLWLLCFQLQERGTWPESRVELLGFYNEENYRRKAEQARRHPGPDTANEPIFPNPETAFAAWERLAYVITTQNRGAAISVSEVVEGGATAEVENLLRVGKRCGVLTESFDGYEHLVRFDHQRLQEYFTARYIHRARPAMAWLDKLDAPRWQETMVNLILLGGADDAIHALAEAINEPIQAHLVEINRWEVEWEEWKAAEAEKDKPQKELEPDEHPLEQEKADKSAPEPARPRLDEQLETIIADRIELASRLMRQLGSGDSKARDCLMPVLRTAISRLVEDGNPITQVKMMRVCQNIPDIDYIQVLEKPLQSPTHWVRNQAITLIAGDERIARAIGSDLPSEIGYDLARGEFLRHFTTYAKAALEKGSWRYWWPLAFGSFSYLLNLVLLLGVAALIYYGAGEYAESKQPAEAILMAKPYSMTIYAGIIFVAVVLSLNINPGWLGAAIWGSAIGSLALYFRVSNAWRDADDTNIPGKLIVWGILSAPIFGVGCAMIHFAALTIYLAVTAQVRRSHRLAGSILKVAWQVNWFSKALNKTFVGVIFGFIVFLYMIKVASTLLDSWLVLPVGVRIGKILYLPFSPRINFVIILITLTVTWKLARKYRSFYSEYIRKTAIHLSEILTRSAIVGVLRRFGRGVATFLTVSRVLSLLLIGLTGFVCKYFSLYMNRGLVIILLLLFSALFLHIFVTILRQLASLFSWNSPIFPPGSFTPEEWKQRITEATATQQGRLLHRTNHQSLDLTPEAFLETLKEINSAIKKEPAASAYWSQRDQLEQVLKQEKQG